MDFQVYKSVYIHVENLSLYRHRDDLGSRSGFGYGQSGHELGSPSGRWTNLVMQNSILMAHSKNHRASYIMYYEGETTRNLSHRQY
jgi:hypothetical protein